MLKRIGCLIVLIVLLTPGNPHAQISIINEAHGAFARNDIPRALELYVRAAAECETTEDRIAATRRASLLQYRYYGDFAAARKTLAEAIATHEVSSPLLHSRAALELAEKNYTAARYTALQATLAAETGRERETAQLLWCKAVIEPLFDNSLDGETLSSDWNSGELRLALVVLTRIVQESPGEPLASILLLRAALMTGDGEQALLAWKSYFQISDQSDPGAILTQAMKLLAELPEWEEKMGSEQFMLQIIAGLTASRLYEEAAFMIDRYNIRNIPESLCIDIAYAQLLRGIRRFTDEYYRQTAIGTGNPEQYSADFQEALRSFWEETAFSTASYPLSEISGSDNTESERAMGRIQSAFQERFGTIMTIGQTAGYLDLHMGHVVFEENRTIEQYGREADFRFILLDTITSNGYQSWAWNFGSQHGGWADEYAMYQVRPAYAAGPIVAWNMISDPESKKKDLEDIKKAYQRDLERAQACSVDYFDCVSKRLQFQGLEELTANLENRGLSGQELQLAFLAEVNRITQNYSIFNHEGRHVIDKNGGITNSEELEFNAKLAQIAFSDYPRLALTNGVFAQNLGAETPHGQANARIMEGYSDWMMAHAEAIPGLDTDLSMTYQLHLLSNDQIRAIARSLDPLSSN